MQTILSFVIVLGVLVTIHELGHLLLAKRAGILCREFAIGFGPKLFSFYKNETMYTIRLLPFGGYVRMAGEDPEIVEIKTGQDVALVLNQAGNVEKIVLNHKREYPEAQLINVQKVDMVHSLKISGYDEDENMQSFDIDRQAHLVYDHQSVQIAPYDRQFGSKTLGERFATLFAGPFANFVLALFIFIGLAMYTGVAQDPIVGGVEPGMPAMEAGLQEGDKILEINGQSIHSWSELSEMVTENPGKESLFLIERANEQYEVSIEPKLIGTEDPRAEGGYYVQIGIQAHQVFSATGAIKQGFAQTIELSTLIFQAVGMLVTGMLGIDALAGPVGIIDITGQVAQAGIIPLFHFAAVLSINFAILNMLPIPALDGGRMVFLGIEAVRGKPLDAHKEGLVTFIGFAFIILLMVMVTWNDIQRAFFSN